MSRRRRRQQVPGLLDIAVIEHVATESNFRLDVDTRRALFVDTGRTPEALKTIIDDRKLGAPRRWASPRRILEP
jgi:hypothetical protein